MRHPHSKNRALARLATLALWALSVAAPAHPGDTLQTFAFYSVTHDNNIFRVDSGKQSDVYQQLGAGLLLDWKQSRQQITGRVGANTTKFADLGVLDFNGYEAQGQWNWQLGNRLAGQVGGAASRSLGTFVDYGGGLTRNTVDRKRAFFNGSYLFHPRGRVSAALDTDSVEYGAVSQQSNDRTLDAAEVGADYLSPKGSRLGLFLRLSQGDYPNRQVRPFPLSTVDNSFEQREIGLRASWALNGLLKMSGRLGQTQRRHDEVPARDFSGLTGRIDATWQPTAKLRVAGAVYRDIGAVDDIYASYAINHGLRVAPSWRISDKLSLDGQAYVERRSFEGDPFSIGFRREDNAVGYGLTLSYQPRQWANLGVSWQGGHRDSNLVNDFDFQTLSLSAQLVF